MAIVEAMASGCVPLVRRDGGPWFDILDQTQGKYGYSYRTIHEASRLIDKLLTEQELAAQLSVKAIARAKDFDSSVFEQKILRIVQRIIVD
jgi:glycosyltransferase involved in cell wall biosynthesis